MAVVGFDRPDTGRTVPKVLLSIRKTKQVKGISEMEVKAGTVARKIEDRDRL